ncbi:hypothetical protein E2C01_036587 [Portunus trituberculatus]|uniref:Uncharacterized protein n=1 Tax=Portunus trituberculatus TaxID=210409 RepID=A0A5B7F928_PORTR|nr:hypothetical protein [Portunus trituberculatus]
MESIITKNFDRRHEIDRGRWREMYKLRIIQENSNHLREDQQNIKSPHLAEVKHQRHLRFGDPEDKLEK